MSFIPLKRTFSIRKRRYKRPGRLLGTLLGAEGGGAFIKVIYLLGEYVNEVQAIAGPTGDYTHLYLSSRPSVCDSVLLT